MEGYLLLLSSISKLNQEVGINQGFYGYLNRIGNRNVWAVGKDSFKGKKTFVNPWRLDGAKLNSSATKT